MKTEEYGRIQKNTEEYGRKRKNTEEYGRIRKNTEEYGKTFVDELATCVWHGRGCSTPYDTRKGRIKGKKKKGGPPTTSGTTQQEQQDEQGISRYRSEQH